MTTDPDVLFSFRAATVARAGGGVAFENLNWTVRDGEAWAVVGPTGSGKSTLAETLLGRHRLTAGEAAWPLLDLARAGGRAAAFPSDVVALVAFKEDSRLFSYRDHYYQQRFEFADEAEAPTVEAYLRAGTPVADADLHAVAGRLGIAGLLGRSFIKLSNGQTRRARIARGLLHRPELLVLDDPFMGLDATGRGDLADLLGGLARGGTRLLLVTRPDSVPSWVTHVLTLRADGAVQCGMRNAECGIETPDLSRPDPPTPRAAGSEIPHSAFRIPHSSVAPFELRNVTVTHGGTAILDRVTWTVGAGERWALVGPNGSGKTTLLSVVCGDHPQAFSNDVRLFGRRRGTGETVWDVKRPVGLVSPELHLYFGGTLTAFEAAATGFFDVLAYRPTTPAQAAVVRELLEAFGVAAVADRPFRRLSTGQQRLVLLARALVKGPPLVVLDEPFQGLDEEAVRRARAWLDERLRPDQALVFVTHLPEELPRTVTRRLRLDAGRVIEVV